MASPKGRRTLAVLVGVAALAGTVYLALRLAPRVRLARVAAEAPALSDCRTALNLRDCYRLALGTLIREAGVGRTMEVLGELARADAQVERDGHEYAHGIGIEGYLHYRTLRETFEECTEGFASGCQHGVIQAYLESQPEVDSAAMNTMCAQYRAVNATGWQLFQCVHGMGHGLNMMLGGDLPGALEHCDQLTSIWERQSCYGGAFMENIMAEIRPHHPATELAGSHHEHTTFKRLDREDLLYPCSIMAQQYLAQCYEIQTSAILYFTDGNVGKTAEACDRAPEDMIRVCYQSLGRDITGRTSRDHRASLRECAETGEAHRRWCWFGVAKSLIDWEARPEEGLAFCRLLDDAEGWEECYRAVGEQIRALTPAAAERERMCSSAPTPAALTECRLGAGIPVPG